MNTAQFTRMYQQRVTDLEAALERVRIICNDPLIKRAKTLRAAVEVEVRYALNHRLALPAEGGSHG